MNTDALRIIDANLNRAREGLRVLEEHARLALDDAQTTECIKQLRHDLAAVAQSLGVESLLRARDIQHDVGTTISTETEQARSSTQAVAAAAAKRCTESLRAIEEYAKLLDPAVARRVEQLRYRAYALEQDLLIGGPVRKRFMRARLHVLVTESLCHRPWLEVCEQALEGGADILQLREKHLDDRELLRRAMQLHELTTQYDAMLFVNDRPDIARLVHAEGVHVGRTDLSVPDVRRIVHADTLVGTSTHSVAEAQEALAESPDYIAVGTMFASGTKPDVQVQGPALLAEIHRLTQVPIVAIGGICEDNIAVLSDVCPTVQIAVCQSVIGAADVRAAASALKAHLQRAN